MASGVSRDTAPVVSTHDGGPAYGGTPSDRSVMEAIAEIRGRGLAVTLYPLPMMDIASGNALSDPYGGASQPAYPWRGRITADPAPAQPGTADRTDEARDQVAAFCGTASPTGFEALPDTIAFTGASDDWGYRRFILHYAHLAVAAGGVDAFLLGSELRGHGHEQDVQRGGGKRGNPAKLGPDGVRTREDREHGDQHETRAREMRVSLSFGRAALIGTSFVVLHVKSPSQGLECRHAETTVGHS